MESEDVLKITVTTKLLPRYFPIQRARITEVGKVKLPPELPAPLGLGVTEVPFTGTPAMVPEYGWGGLVPPGGR